MPADVTITEFTDPACPWAFSAEPYRLRLNWLYGEAIEWRHVMVVLSEDPADYEKKGMTKEKLADGVAMISKKHGMPIDTAVPERLQATLPACRAVVAARLYAPEAEMALLRNLRVRNFSGQLLDDPATIFGAVQDADISKSDLDEWVLGEEVEKALREDMRAARHPGEEALALNDRLADWEGGRRYTCPSYEFERASDGARQSAPGFQPFAVSDVAMANLLPHAERRAKPEDVAEVLEWAPHSLATREVAEICELDDVEARQRLGHVATERPVGSDGFWSL